MNITWYLKREGLLVTTESAALDYYLVLAGPRSAAVSSRGTTRPWCIEAVFVATDCYAAHDVLGS